MDTKKTLCRIGQKMKEAGLVAACDGNISFRRDDGTVVITPSGVPKGELKPKHLLVVDLDGHVLEGTGKASSESALHLEIYRKRDDVRAIIHAHPVTATACAEAAEGADVFLMERHGAATVGRDLEQAFYRLETLETVAKMYRDSLIFAATSSQQKNNPAAKAQPLSWYLKQ